MSVTRMGVAELGRLSWEELELAIEEQEAPLIRQLAELEERALSSAARVEKKREIRDKRREFEQVRATWRHLHKRKERGPDQTIEAGGVAAGEVKTSEVSRE